ncbi:MAG: hypothetical protein KDJ54_01290 [Candidatus Competibacteraceae bacterium]|nr:hypothetical protein [Candidatus Competibacteraceae bacterium]
MKCLTGSGLIVLSLLATPVLAANKCVDPSGRISYQAMPCPEHSRGGDMSLNVNRPFAGRSSGPVADPYVLGIDFVASPPTVEPDQPVQPVQPDQPVQPVVQPLDANP